MNKSKVFTLVVTSALLADVAAVLKDADKHRYSASKVYAAYNAVTGKNDTPQTCSSCLRSRVAELRKWYADQMKGGIDYGQGQDEGGEFVVKHGLPEILKADNIVLEKLDPIGKPDDDTTPPQDEERPDGRVDPLPDNIVVTGFIEPPIDVICLHVPVLELPVYFEPGTKDPNKGRAYYQGGGTIKPGKYETSDNRELAVQPGGKATLKGIAEENDLL